MLRSLKLFDGSSSRTACVSRCGGRILRRSTGTPDFYIYCRARHEKPRKGFFVERGTKTQKFSYIAEQKTQIFVKRSRKTNFYFLLFIIFCDMKFVMILREKKYLFMF